MGLVYSQAVSLLKTGVSFFKLMTTTWSYCNSKQPEQQPWTPSRKSSAHHHSDVLCVHPQHVSSLAPCSHEEADTLIMLHVEDAVKQEHTKVSIRTVDTNVVILAATSAQRLNIPELWIVFGTAKTFQLFAGHSMARTLGPDRSVTFPMFHAFTGYDSVILQGIGK